MARADEWGQSNVEVFGSKEEVLTRTRGLGEVRRVKEVLTHKTGEVSAVGSPKGRSNG